MTTATAVEAVVEANSDRSQPSWIGVIRIDPTVRIRPRATATPGWMNRSSQLPDVLSALIK